MILEYIKLSLNELFNNKLRSFLSLIGIVIGVAVVFIIFSISDIANVAITNQITGNNGAININYVKDRKNAEEILSQSFGSNFGMSSSKTFYYSLADLDVLRKVEGVSDAMANYTAQAQGVLDRKKFSVTVKKNTDNFIDFFGHKVLNGKLFSEYNSKERVNLAIVSEKFVENTLKIKNEEAIGKTINIKNRVFTIVGVIDSPMKANASFVLLPTEAYELMFSDSTIGFLSVKIAPGSDLKKTSTNAVIELNKAHNYIDTKNGYVLEDLSFITNQIKQMTGILSIVMGIIASISLLVAGIGVMNIMLVSVVERTKEIGVKRAIGASKGAIQFQFMIESCLLTLLGGVFGVVIGMGVIQLALILLKMQLPINIGYVVFSLVFSLSLGLLFGYLPSKRAANLNIIEAIQSE